MLQTTERETIYQRAAYLLTVLFFMSFYIFETKTWGSYILFLLGGAIFALGLLKQRSLRPIRFGMFHVFILVFAAYILLTALWAWKPVYAIEKASTMIKILLVMSMIYWYYVQEDDLFRLIKLVMWAAYGIVFYAYAYYGAHHILMKVIWGSRIENTFTNANSIGMLAAFAIMINVYTVIYDRIRPWALLMLPTLVMILATGSRKAFAILIFGIAMILFFHLTVNKTIWKMMLYVVFLMIGMLVVLWLISIIPVFDGIWSRMEGFLSLLTGKGEVDHSTWIRQEYIRTGLAQFVETPLFGMGIGNPRILAFRDYGTDCYLHNNFAELLAGGGIVGFVLYYAMFGYTLFYFLKYRRFGDKNTAFCLTMLVLLIILDYAAVSYYYKSTYFYLMIFFLQARKLKQQYGRKANESETTASGGDTVSV